ncbi:MAG: hypothetical protein EP330_26965 [Deltaproteobacteria bacterium]|nr:MAG: hypothetical protein EP330_26965 [Deltaproteobacteria bacterium]
MTLDDLLTLSNAELWSLLDGGHPIDREAVADRQMNGVSLAPGLVRHTVAWTKFRKTFKREPDGSLRGWNIACEQTPLDQPWVHKQRRGEPRTYWHYRICGHDGLEMPGKRGLVIDYTTGGNHRLDYMNRVRDPLVAVNPDDPDLLLGLSMFAVGSRHLTLPFTWFVLAGGDPLDHDATPPRGVQPAP